MYNGSNDSFNFKPHELTPKNPTKNFLWPRLAIQLSKERFLPATYCSKIVCHLKNSKQKNVPTKLSGRKFYLFLAPLLSMRINC